ncbi:transferase [Pedobacter sp. G11]|uniref:carbamoyltransferase family protein n=1 Tax=Pedobacter sp. G11 TaxID=2482728 RepID=UPI000F5EF4EF|nr:carbamoyltransferase C-terminal domain-containing protein [Pedobacter sp. G11]AZI24180.1 transferase [Pedobacter sp. G11]
MDTYILGTGLSHDGSTVLLKNGKILVAIEKERLTRVKHDGGNDFNTVQYCLDFAGIKASDLALIVQASNFENNISPGQYAGRRYFDGYIQTPVITLSHHLAHAWSAVGMSPFEECNVMIVDGAGSPYAQCLDLEGTTTPSYPFSNGMYCEKDSFYHFNGKTLIPLFKDFSEVKLFQECHSLKLPTNYHSIGGLYHAASQYCFGNMNDVGKLMGLAPFGILNGKPPLFKLESGIIEVLYKNVDAYFNKPSSGYDTFKNDFKHYADMARWVQDETEKAIIYLFKERSKLYPHANFAYAGGVALNAVANFKLRRSGIVKNLYTQPAAGDNGIAIGCAYYGWHEILGQQKASIPDHVFFGRSYSNDDVEKALSDAGIIGNTAFSINQTTKFVALTAEELGRGKVVGWFQGGAEFGPRALGHRSILADPRIKDIKNHINSAIKFREDFRPFAPSVRIDDVQKYFIHGWESPYMILIDEIKPEWKNQLDGIVHRDGTCRVQTVTSAFNPDFYQLISDFEAITGIGVLLNTSLNRKGMPIVETPAEALSLFLSGAIDVLVLNNFIICKHHDLLL